MIESKGLTGSEQADLARAANVRDLVLARKEVLADEVLVVTVEV